MLIRKVVTTKHDGRELPRVANHPAPLLLSGVEREVSDEMKKASDELQIVALGS